MWLEVDEDARCVKSEDGTLTDWKHDECVEPGDVIVSFDECSFDRCMES